MKAESNGIEAAVDEIGGFLERSRYRAEPTRGAAERRNYFQQLLFYFDLQPPEETAKFLLDAARSGDEEMDLILRQWTAATIRSGAPIPESLRDYVADVLLGKTTRHRGRSKFYFQSRDMTIATAVWATIQRGFKATRNVASEDLQKRECACSIVAKATARIGGPTLSEAAVVKIWTKSPFVEMLNKFLNEKSPKMLARIREAWLAPGPGH